MVENVRDSGFQVDALQGVGAQSDLENSSSRVSPLRRGHRVEQAFYIRQDLDAAEHLILRGRLRVAPDEDFPPLPVDITPAHPWASV